jgi:hypothetical protein
MHTVTARMVRIAHPLYSAVGMKKGALCRTREFQPQEDGSAPEAGIAGFRGVAAAPGSWCSNVIRQPSGPNGYAYMLTDKLITDETAVACMDITDWAVWPSSQNMDLFCSYRRYLEEPRLLIDAHFHEFTAAAANQFRNILHLGLISLFDVAGAGTTTDFRFYASHDKYIEVEWYEGADWETTTKWFFAP